MNIKNKVILLTGASSGIGRATALALSKYNNKIIITARRKKLLEEIALLINENGSECLIFDGDATDEKFAEMIIHSIVEKYNRIDIALLNVGIGPPSNTLTASAETIKKCMRTNYDTMINFFVPLIKQMKNQNSKAMIAQMNSLASYFGIPMQGDYTASKGAARLFLETARMELKHFNIKNIAIQTIHPGFVDTEAVRNDGIPAPNEISEDKAAKYILKGLQKEMRENQFPFGTSFATKLGKILPHWLLTKILLSSTPKNY